MTPSWPHHNTLVTSPQHLRDRTTTPSWICHKGLLKPSPTRLLVAHKARNFPHREAFRLEDSSLLPPFSAMRPAIWPQNSFLRGSVCWNSEPLTSAQRIGKSIEKGVKHVFWGLQEAGKSRFLYLFQDNCHGNRKIRNVVSCWYTDFYIKTQMAVCFSFSCFSCYFEGVHFLIFICNYLYIRYLYRYKKECIPHFFNWNNWNWTPGRVISTLPSLGLWTAFHEWVVSTAILLLY